MLRALLRSPRLRVSPVGPAVRLTRYASPNLVRLQSTKPNPPSEQQAAIKAALEKNDNLQRDWDAKVLTYLELKPRTESPTAVRLLSLLAN
ncbi:hypothetical protein BDN72DRAFT_830038 [Pluteus cervinus]|uniref:Uncharacterized protein n=1 Tax=Pluteus cervinus TaxID=181527 RepID=A0ACD3BFQ3_9AGAR|nr:hypothetical protein BDN72DRAFT_830038 [Pluteus cervinus]